MFEFHRNERARQLRPSLSRSWLLVRANSSEEVFEEAFESEADSIIIDLEDGCPPEEKDAAREQVVRMLNSGVVAWVRINAITTEHWWKDVKALKNVKGLRGVMLATAEHATDIDRTAAELPPGTPIIALIESALGVHHSIEIARESALSASHSAQATTAATPAPPQPPWRSPTCVRSWSSPPPWVVCPAPSTARLSAHTVLTSPRHAATRTTTA